MKGVFGSREVVLRGAGREGALAQHASLIDSEQADLD